MKTGIITTLCCTLLLGSLTSGHGQGSAFTYQGQLKDTNGPVNGNYDFLFLVFDSLTNGVQQGITVGRFGVGVSNGLFTTTLDFGSNTFTGLPLWLEIQVAPASTASFVTLAPRQPFTSSPYAIRAQNAASASTATSVPWLALSGVPPGFADGVDDNTFYSAGAGLNLVGTTFSLNPAYTDTLYWKLAGNAGTTLGLNFLGTVDNQALEFKVNGIRALRLEPTINAPNVIGGSSGNAVTLGVDGAVIGGGADNTVSGIFATIGGGTNNTANNQFATIAGGKHNIASGGYSTVGGGDANFAEGGWATVAGGVNNFALGLDSTVGGGYYNHANSDHATIAGGWANIADGPGAFVGGGGYSGGVSPAGNKARSENAVIGGGRQNIIQTNADTSVICGGSNNVIQAEAVSATITGGRNNVVASDLGTISGGADNFIATETIYFGGGTIGGGQRNYIGINCDGSAIGGGNANTNAADSWGTTIAGGAFNYIGTNCDYSAIAGGTENYIANEARGGAIAGGYYNRIGVNADNGAISGGLANTIGDDSSYATVGGGLENLVSSNAWYATIAGGFTNVIQFDADDATISGGANQIIGTNADYSTIGGGNLNTIEAEASRATIAGGAGHLIRTNADYATIPGGRYAQADKYGQCAYASGRFAVTGDAQTSLYVLRGTTANATQTEVFLDGISARMKVPNGASWTFEALIVARSTTGDTAGYRLTGVVENVGGNMGGTFQAPQILREDVAAWDASAMTDNVNDALIIRVTGAAGTNIRWVASVRTVEVTY